MQRCRLGKNEQCGMQIQGGTMKLVGFTVRDHLVFRIVVNFMVMFTQTGSISSVTSDLEEKSSIDYSNE